ncbi:alpha/beta-hydrolase [Aspergillus ellipticus CBS 707.79]|uniref:Alpha/beta-hydrolase n=1 Tax=Aspergillus ellipticus CBS 707.79 TaxID=1448320 RepID=A0A319DWV3_9EURO|nr:alpha/beta-hydrolase [Aspergillus ellipticus CBS 707.79]
MPTTPQKSDFPSHLTLTITPPTPTLSPPKAPPNILLLLHGLGDTSQNFTPLARSLNLPETLVLTIQAPLPLPFDLGGFHWGDDVTFSPAGDLDMDAGFTRSSRVLVQEVILDTLVKKCGYRVRDICVFGLGQGGMAGLEAARGLRKMGEEALGGVVSVGGAVALGLPSGGSTAAAGSGKSRTPVLVVGGREDSSAVNEAGVRRTKEWFEFVEVHRYARRGDGMPRSREEMFPVMAFLARRLRSWKGVPEGSVEIS